MKIHSSQLSQIHSAEAAKLMMMKPDIIFSDELLLITRPRRYIHGWKPNPRRRSAALADGDACAR